MAGWPLHSHPAQLTETKDCILCMTCVEGLPPPEMAFETTLQRFSACLG